MALIMTPAIRFYEALCAKDYATMAKCYADDAQFSDPIFPKLNAAQTRAMWTMLLEPAKHLELTYEILEETEEYANVAWAAHYYFEHTGRQVVSEVESALLFRNGKIIHHVDEFDFWAWARQAYGFKGFLLGWAPAMRGQMQNSAAEKLSDYIKNQPRVRAAGLGF